MCEALWMREAGGRAALQGPVSGSEKQGFNPRGEAMRLVDAITSLGGLLVPIVALLVGGAIAITTMILRHQERIAKIERGIDPDAGRPRN